MNEYVFLLDWEIPAGLEMGITVPPHGKLSNFVRFFGSHYS